MRCINTGPKSKFTGSLHPVTWSATLVGGGEGANESTGVPSERVCGHAT